MKILVLLFAALLVAGCGEKSSSEGSESASESAEPSADTAKPPPAETPVAESSSKEPSETPKSLSDADVERLLKEAIDIESLEERDDLLYQNNEPFSGWGKMMYDSGQVQGLVQLKDGKMTGLMTAWHENGQKMKEGTYKDGYWDGFHTTWHENGQKRREVTVSDGEVISDKWWNNKGEEVETADESVPAAKRPKNNTPINGN
jgi:hypothetical protein